MQLSNRRLASWSTRWAAVSAPRGPKKRATAGARAPRAAADAARVAKGGAAGWPRARGHVVPPGAFGGNKGAGNWSAGLGATIFQKYLINLSYIGYYGDYSTAANGAASIFNGSSASIADRGWVSLTFKTTF